MSNWPKRKYRDDEEPKAGDVLCLFGDAFNTAIVTKVEDGLAHLERPHMSLSSTTQTPCVMIERFTMHLPLHKKDVEVYTTGHSGNVDNRSGR
jgi:hypothetical protein